MTFTIGTPIVRCAGLNHYLVPLTIGGQSRTLVVSVDELNEDPAPDEVTARANIVDRLRSALKEANAATFAQARTALEGKTFKV